MSQGLKTTSPFRGLLICILISSSLVFAQESVSAPQSVKQPVATVQELVEMRGKADTAVLEWIIANSGPVKGDMRIGGLRVAFTITPAEGWWDKAAGGKLAWHDAPANSVHLRIFVLGLPDGSLLPGLTIRATLTDANGNEQSVPADFGWYPLMNAYGGNVPIAADSKYSLRVVIEGQSFSDRVIAQFPPVEIAAATVSGLPLASALGFAQESALLKPCNAALSAAITALWQHAETGLEKADKDYFVAFALDQSEVENRPQALWQRMFGGQHGARLNLVIRDSRTGRFMPGLKPEAQLVAVDGKSMSTGELTLSPDTWLNHYGQSARVSRKAVYKLRVQFEAPAYRRWGHQSERFALPGEVEFEGVSLTPANPTPEKQASEAPEQTNP